jgi:polar amino acid transport system permease protein
MLHYLTLPFLLQGALLTLELAAAGYLGGLVLGALLTGIGSLPVPPLKWLVRAYVWFHRSVPMLLILIFLYDFLPSAGIKLGANVCVILAIGLGQAAYVSEILRGGVESVPRAQHLAARSLRIGRLSTGVRIILPQALRATIPALTNQATIAVKETALASVVGVNELMLRSEQIVSTNYEYLDVFAAATVMYLVMTGALSGIGEAAQHWFSLDRTRRSHVRRSWRASARGGDAAALARQVNATMDRLAGEQRGDRKRPALGEPLIECRDVRKSYDDQVVLAGVSLTIRRGEVVVLMGRSGSGKSTLLRLIDNLETVSGGEILVGTASLPARGIRTGMVFQDYNLFENMTLLENMTEAPIGVYGVPPKEARRIGIRSLECMGLGDKIDTRPHRLSGGQRQRAAIARALCVAPEVIVMDEPTSALDPDLVDEVLQSIRQLADLGIALLIATHEIRLAQLVADRVVLLRDGSLVADGPAEQVLPMWKTFDGTRTAVTTGAGNDK